MLTSIDKATIIDDLDNLIFEKLGLDWDNEDWDRLIWLSVIRSYYSTGRFINDL